MKILGLCCSPRTKGNTEQLMTVALEGSRQEGAETELYSLAGKEIKPCTACGACAGGGVCSIRDDMDEVYPKLLEADGIIFGSPIYYYTLAAQAKALIDRTFALNQPGKNLANKVGGVIVTAGSMGLVDGLKDLYFYMVTKQIIPANFVAAYPVPEVDALEKGKAAAGDLGRQMVQIAVQKFEYPAQFPRSGFAYGTHTR